jgi:hypothetical protein
MEIITNELIDKGIVELWNEFKDKEFCKYNPLAPKKIKKKSLLFIGLNPSIRKNDTPINFNNCLENYYYPPRTDRYWSKFYKIAENCGFQDNWAHFDLLFLRGDQKFVEKTIKNKENKGEIFIWKQLQFSKKLLEQSEPKFIVISNKLATELTGKNRIEKNGQILGEWMNLRFEKQNNHFLLNGIPVIFSKQPNQFFKNTEMDELINQIIELKKLYNIE